MAILMLVGIILVIVILAATYWAVMTKDYGPDPLTEIQRLSNLAAELAETAKLYRQMGMNEDADEALAESQRVNEMVWDVLNGKEPKA